MKEERKKGGKKEDQLKNTKVSRHLFLQICASRKLCDLSLQQDTGRNFSLSLDLKCDSEKSSPRE